MPSQEDPGPSDVRALLQSTRTPFAVARYAREAVIFLQGDPGDSVLHIERGRVLLAVTAPSGKEAICGFLGTGAFLGEEVLGGHEVRRQTATAMTATELLIVPKEQMIRLLRTKGAILDRFIAHIVARHTSLEADLTDQLLNSSEQRLARALLVLAGCRERRPCQCVLPGVSQETIAEMVGTTRSRVNAFMGKFKRLGFIEEDGGVLQINPSLLRVVQDGIRGVSPGTFPTTSQPGHRQGSASGHRAEPRSTDAQIETRGYKDTDGRTRRKVQREIDHRSDCGGNPGAHASAGARQRAGEATR